MVRRAMDLQAGRAAGAATVWVDAGGKGEAARLADLVVPDLLALGAALAE